MNARTPQALSLDDEKFRVVFMRRVTKGDECWIFQSAPAEFGYGRFCYNKKVYRAHRASYALFVGNIPHGFIVRHRCDNPPCVNPDHLELGTVADNMADMKARKRGRGPGYVGEEHNRAVLTNKLVQTIRSEYAAGGISQHQLARKFGINRATLQCVISRRTWRHVP